ncbi:MAG: NADH:ubiquinone reductase (Na(+)-transporting) subunit B [Chitinivibrionales bacterium]|nr:NADH:ubiquinone reductase (Na(+)-transporting) subunit B [Chitinivibrionales bacterium]
MKFIADTLEKVKPNFEKGGKLEWAYPAFEAAETFVLTPDTVTRGRVHIRDWLDSKRLMTTVVVALLPCTLMAMWNTGMQRMIATGAQPNHLLAIGLGALAFLPLYFITVAAGGLWEVLFAVVRKHEVNEGFFVTSLLFPLIVPPTLPYWQAAVAISFGVVIGKEVFGGTGRNILNPALTARAFLFFSWPGQISGEGIWRFVDSSKDKIVDGISAATPLGVAAVAQSGGDIIKAVNEAGYTFTDLFLGTIPGSMGETSTLACLLGAAYLILTKIGSWRIMLSCVIGALLISTLLNLLSGQVENPMFSVPPHYHLVMGGFAFGAVFMATDPVSAAATNTGKWIYGFLIGALAITIRTVNPAYPEGMMLAILLMNVFAPIIDHVVAQANIKRRLLRGAR